MSEEEERLRLFAAIQLPEEWLRALVGIQTRVERTAAGELRWVRPELMHVTLVFLGYQPAELLPEIESAMETAATEGRQFRLTLGRLGAFGPPHGITVVWAGLTEMPQAMERLHQSLSAHLSARKVAFDRKPLVPHITLARGKRPMDRGASLRISAALKELELPKGLTTPVEDFVLMRSRLSPKGPSYEVVRDSRLGGVADV